MLVNEKVKNLKKKAYLSGQVLAEKNYNKQLDLMKKRMEKSLNTVEKAHEKEVSLISKQVTRKINRLDFIYYHPGHLNKTLPLKTHL